MAEKDRLDRIEQHQTEIEDEILRLHAVNAQLLEALKRIETRCDIDPTNLPIKMFTGEIKSMARAAIELANKPLSQ